MNVRKLSDQAGQADQAGLADQAENPPASASMDAELDALAAEAAFIDAGAAGPAPGATTALPPSNNADDLRGALQLARVMLTPAFAWWPQFGEVWNDRTLDGIAAAGGQVMDRHGWTMGEVMTTWGPYVALAVATAPPVLATAQAVKAARRAAEEEERRRRAGPPQPVTPVTPEPAAA